MHDPCTSQMPSLSVEATHLEYVELAGSYPFAHEYFTTLSIARCRTSPGRAFDMEGNAIGQYSFFAAQVDVGF